MRVILLLFLVFFPGLVSAELVDDLRVDIRVADSFDVGEKVAFEYEILSDEDINVEYEAYVECGEGVPQMFPDYRVEKIEKGGSVVEKIFGVVIERGFYAEECFAVVNVMSPFEKRFEESFGINTKPKVEMNFLICTDAECDIEKKNWKLGDFVYLDYRAEQKFEVFVNVTEPSGEEERILLPLYYKVDEVGEYILEFEFSEEGFQSNVEFFNIESRGVIEKKEEERIRGGIDIEGGAFKKIMKLMVVLVVVVLIIIVGRYVRRKKKRNNAGSGMQEEGMGDDVEKGS